MPTYTVTIPEYDELDWQNTDGGASWEVSFNGIDIGVTTIDGSYDVSIWYSGGFCDGVEIDLDDLHSMEDVKEAAYVAAVDVLHEVLMECGAEAEEE